MQSNFLVCLKVVLFSRILGLFHWHSPEALSWPKGPGKKKLLERNSLPHKVNPYVMPKEAARY
jgi:hypothetical protein